MRGIADVRDHRHGLSLAEFGGRGLELRALDVDQQDLGAFGNEEPRGREADAGGGAGDDCNLARKPGHPLYPHDV